MKSLIAFGDSVIKGVVYSDSKYRQLRDNFINIAAQRLGFEINNTARFGATVCDGMRIVEKNAQNIKESSSDYVLMEFGGNDSDFRWSEISEKPRLNHRPKTEPEMFFSVYSSMIKKVKELGKKPVLISLPPIDPYKYIDRLSEKLNRDNMLIWLDNNIQRVADWHEMYNIEVFKIAIANNVRVIDITSGFYEKGSYSRFLCNDGVHPNEEGHRIIGNEVISFALENEKYINEKAFI